MAVSRDQFYECLAKSGLMSASDITAFQKSVAADLKDGDITALGNELVKQKKLTTYQAGLLTQGQSKGLVFGEYTVLDKIGEGGMGLVFKAQHRNLKRIVALKVLHPAVTQTEEAVKRFHREVEAMARLHHPNIVAAFDAGNQDGTYYLVLEYVDGIDFARLVKDQGLLTVPKAVNYVLQVARGLDHTHKRGIVHRDIKPSNLLLDGEGTVKILDMGLVRFTESQRKDGKTDDGLTETGDIMGSFDYIAPEQAIDTKRADQRADIYSLGCTLHYLLTGKPPYVGDTSMQKLLAHRDTAIPALRKVRTDVPLALDAVFHRMVAKKSEDRYETMSEVIRDLDACREGLAKKDASPSMLVSAPTSSPGLSRLVILSGLLCILAALGAHIFLAWQSAERAWAIPEHVMTITTMTLLAGIGMVLIGIVMRLIGVLTERWNRAVAGQPVKPGGVLWLVIRWLLGLIAGIVVGAIAGGVIGAALANHEDERVRLAGSVVVGAFAGAALGGRRTWLAILGGAITGFFAGSEIGKRMLVLPEIDRTLAPEEVAILGFAVVGAIVGAVLGVDRRNGAGKKSDTQVRPMMVSENNLVDEEVSSGKTVRRAPR